MRLYVNTKEVPLLKQALIECIHQSQTQIERDRYVNLLERVILCEELQKSERRAKKEEVTNHD